MTKETRALIEAAEDHLLYACTSTKRLRDAISSAKAAEEEVETEHEHVSVCDERGPKTKERCRREAGHSGRHTGRSEGWYTTVIEVREKEGLCTMKPTKN